jgi:quinol monooxygenase YgiN
MIIAVLAGTFPIPAYAEDVPMYLATYIEITPKAIDAAAALLQRYRDASRTQAGCSHFDVLQEIARPERFAILEVWSGKAALDNHDKTTSTVQFREKLIGIQAAPYDERVNRGLYLGPIATGSRPEAIYVLTHVDLIPESNGQGLALLKTMRDSSSQEPGSLAYDVLQQDNRPNHFTIVEKWKSATALDAHVASERTRAFRQALLPMEGAPYDDRRYRTLR